jgi:hypothetical protein
MESGDPAQERAHEAVSRVIIDTDAEVPDDALVTCWTIVYEFATVNGCRHVGYLRGPDPTATEWAQRGLMDMARAMLDAGVTAYEIRNADPEEE